MTGLSRKLIAVLMMLWLPLSSGNALASSLSMQMQGDCCPDATAMQMGMDDDMSAHHQHHSQSPASTDEQNTAGDNCGVCHLACSGFMTVPGIEISMLQTTVRETTPYLVSFKSVTTIPLLPPPLVRA